MPPCFSLSTELFASRVGGSDLFPQLFDDGQHLGVLALWHLAVPSCLARSHSAAAGTARTLPYWWGMGGHSQRPWGRWQACVQSSSHCKTCPEPQGCDAQLSQACEVVAAESGSLRQCASQCACPCALERSRTVLVVDGSRSTSRYDLLLLF